VSAYRRPVIPFSEAPRGTCRWCGESILHPKGSKEGELDRRRRWHPACVDVYNASDPREARRRVRRRDRGRCADCGVDTYAVKREVRGKGMTRKLRERGYVPRRSLWELDHIVPLIDGGSHAIDNLQTLCTPCHKQKTAAEARERSARTRQTSSTEAPSSSEPAGAREPACADLPDTRLSPQLGPHLTPPRSPRLSPHARSGDLDALLDHASRLNERVHAMLDRFRVPR